MVRAEGVTNRPEGSQLAMELRISSISIALSLALLCFCVTSVTSQPGFLNIDCGSTKNYSDYYFNWVTDTGYISTGHNSGLVFAKGDETNFRFFNDTRKKHCYTLPTLPETTYLLRASFLYGNYSELYGNITFDLTIGSTHWTTINIEPVVDWRSGDNFGVQYIMRREVLVRSNGTKLFMCLLRKSGLPFITSLQLRTFADNMYEEVKNNQILVKESRWSASIWDEIRYPDDPYDRIWGSYETNYMYNDQGLQMYATDEQSLKFENTTEIPTSTEINRPPVYVMENAYIWNETTKEAWFYQTNLTELNGRYYAALYFQEIMDLANATATKSSRNLSVGFNGGDAVSGDITVTSEVSTISTVFETADSSFNFTFTQSSDSKLGPMFNALELYRVYPVDPSVTAEEDVVALEYLQASLEGIGTWNGDPCRPVAWEWLTCNDAQPARVTQLKLSNYWLRGNLSPNITGLTALTDLLLDRNLIHGNIPDLGLLQNLKRVHLQNNSLEGPIPRGLATLPALEELFVQNNNLSGAIPSELLTPRNGVNFSFVFDGNEYLQTCLPGSGPCLPSNPLDHSIPPGAPPGGRRKEGVQPALIAGVVAGGAGVLIALVFVYCFCLKKPQNGAVSGSAAKKGGIWGDKDGSQQLQARVFNLAEITTITHNFVQKLGQGSFGPVYYGKLPDGQEVAVKVNAADSSQGTEEFVNEVVLLSRVHHKYLVSLVGYCKAPQQHILVYAYMPNGTLTEHLHGEKARSDPLTWKQRLDIALNAAQGLEYLHTFCNPPIIHRDIKPSNILLDNNLMAKVADFGMSKSAPEESRTGFSTAVKGTFGYLDPEYLSGWRLTTKSDVYSFGVILLELITGRKPTSVIHFADGTQGNFMGWAKSAQRSGDIYSIVDPDLNGKFNTEAMWKVAEMAWGSVESQGTNRPDMGEIVRGLMEAIQLENADVGSKGGDLGPHDLSYASSRTSYSSTAPLTSQLHPSSSYASVSTFDADISQYHQPR